MSKGTLYLIISLIIIAGITIIYFSFGSKLFKPKEEADFQLVLPQESTYELKELELMVKSAATLRFEEPEEIEVSSVEKGKFKVKADSFLSEEKPFGKISVFAPRQPDKKDTPKIIMSTYLFYRPFVKENFSQEFQNSLDPYLWPSEDSITIDFRSTAFTCLLNGHLTSYKGTSENPFSYYSFTSSKKALTAFSEPLSNSKYPTLQSEVKNLLIDGINFPSICFEKEVTDIILKIFGLGETPSTSPSQDQQEKEEIIKPGEK